MALYMTQYALTPEAWAALAKKPEDRSVQLKTVMEKLGGRLLGFYYCFGEYDGVVISEMPDNFSQMTVLLAVIAPGHMKSCKTTVLMTLEDAMKAMKSAGEIAYKPPTA